MDAQANNLNTPQKPQTSLKTIKLYESILELEAQERRLKRRVTELLLVEEYLVKNTNALKSFSTEGISFISEVVNFYIDIYAISLQFL